MFLTDHDSGFLPTWASLSLPYFKWTPNAHTLSPWEPLGGQVTYTGSAVPLSSFLVNLGQSLALGPGVFSQRVPRGLPKLAQLVLWMGNHCMEGPSIGIPWPWPLSFIPGDTPPWFSIFSTIKENQITVNAFPVLLFYSHHLVPLIHRH